MRLSALKRLKRLKLIMRVERLRARLSAQCARGVIGVYRPRPLSARRPGARGV